MSILVIELISTAAGILAENAAREVLEELFKDLH